MPDGPRLPFPEEQILELVRARMASQGWKVGNREVAQDVPLRIGHCVAYRRAADLNLIAYGVTVMIDPKLGVP